MQSDCVATDMAVISSSIQPWPQIVVYGMLRKWERDLKARNGASEVQPEEGSEIVRWKTGLDGVGVAEEVDVDDDGDGAGAGVDVGHVSLPREMASSREWLLRSIVLPMNPPTTPAMIISSTP